MLVVCKRKDRSAFFQVGMLWINKGFSTLANFTISFLQNTWAGVREMGKAIRAGQVGMCKMKLRQAVKQHSSLQYLVVAVLVQNTSAHSRVKCRRQLAAQRSNTIQHLLRLYFTPAAQEHPAVKMLFWEGGAFSYLFQ